ncbi:UNVERIFIED_CONTAM: hypothetical protein K2H54_049751 [Gekko kuhli]
MCVQRSESLLKKENLIFIIILLTFVGMHQPRASRRDKTAALRQIVGCLQVLLSKILLLSNVHSFQCGSLGYLSQNAIEMSGSCGAAVHGLFYERQQEYIISY